MKTIYLDPDFRCYVTDDGTRQAVETDVFDGKCYAYIEGYRFIPAGQTWTREDGEVFRGEMVSPWMPWEKLNDAQREYEQEQYQTLVAENAAMTAQLAALDTEYQKGVNSL